MASGHKKSEQFADKLRWCKCGEYETAADDGLCGVCYATKASGGFSFYERLIMARKSSMVDEHEVLS